MELMRRLKDIVPWRRKPVETHEVVALRDNINHLFDRFLSDPFGHDWWPLSGTGPRPFGWPPLDVEETDDELVLRLEVPGLDPKDLDVTVRSGVLQIRAERKEEEALNGGYARRYGSFSRTLALPEGLDTDAARATCRHGLLVVRIPRSQEAKERVRRISVQG